ncbi:MAG: WYL domain-containing protein [Oscillospiraceae bacterium]|nr:WYL domain-containing protein [Oscillospiraceae bacterium]
MPKSPNQKMKPLLLQRILLERTDEDHGLTVPELIALLEEEGVAAERKSVYSDLQTLADFGLEIVKRKESGKVVYYVGARTFELPELKLLVDAVQSSRFITHKKSNQLIQKVEGFASRYQAQQLQRQVFVANRVKTMNESIYINVDKIYEAIAANRRITYRYLDWAFRDGAAGGYEKQFRRQGKTYRISPWSLCWADERYYMIGFDSEAGLIKHYRVDKMLGIALTDEPRDGQEHFEHFDMAVYTRQVFGMFGGNEQTVTLRFENRLLGVVLDRFGEDVPIRREDADTFQVRVRVAVSPQFLSWVFSFGGGARIVSPAAVADTMREQLASVMKQYTETEGR